MDIFSILKVTVLIAVLLCSTGCSTLFFYPSKRFLGTPDELGFVYEPRTIVTLDRRLSGWYLPATDTYKGSVLFYHGNSSNISGHFGFIHWLPAQGYDVYLYDYQGYGHSSGTATINNAVSDVRLMFDDALRHTYRTHTYQARFIIYGHSLGGSLFASTLTDLQNDLDLIDAVVIDSSFSNFRLIAREKMQLLLLTRALKHPLGLLFPDKPDPATNLAVLKETPLLIAHAMQDKVVTSNHAEILYASASTAYKAFYGLQDQRHNHGFINLEDRQFFLSFLSQPTNHSGYLGQHDAPYTVFQLPKSQTQWSPGRIRRHRLQP